MHERPGRPPKIITAHERDMLRQWSHEGCGLHVLTRLLNEARVAEEGEEAVSVSQWRVLEELRDMDYESTPSGYAPKKRSSGLPWLALGALVLAWFLWRFFAPQPEDQA